jgi:hypothetical protein
MFELLFVGLVWWGLSKIWPGYESSHEWDYFKGEEVTLENPPWEVGDE